MPQHKAYRYRFYPTTEQAQQLAQSFGCSRFIYNWGLRLRTDAWFKNQQSMNYHNTAKLLTELKQQPETQWLNDVSNVVLQQSLRHLDTAFRGFFKKKSAYPTFKHKRGNQSVSYMNNGFTFRNNQIVLAKQKEPLQIKWSRALPEDAKVTSITISKDVVNRYHISILTEVDIEQLPKLDTIIALDMGLKTFAVDQFNNKIENPKFLAKKQKRLARYQRKCSRKLEFAKASLGLKGKAVPKGTKLPKSNNHQKAIARVNRLQVKVSDSRNDFLQKETTRIIRENQTIVVEDLAVYNMVKNRKLSKFISDVSWGKFFSMLEYKSKWYGRELIVIDRWLPTSKRCSSCGYILDKLDLSIREWECPECKEVHERDHNAAKNILLAGLATKNTVGQTGINDCQI